MNICLMELNCFCRQSSREATHERLLLIRGNRGRSMQSWKGCWLWYPARSLPSCHCVPVSGLGCQCEALLSVSQTLGPSNAFPQVKVPFSSATETIYWISVLYCLKVFESSEWRWIAECRELLWVVLASRTDNHPKFWKFCFILSQQHTCVKYVSASHLKSGIQSSL